MLFVHVPLVQSEATPHTPPTVFTLNFEFLVYVNIEYTFQKVEE